MAPAPDHRTELFTVRMTADEKAMLRALAELDGLSASDTVRLIIRQKYTERIGTKKPKRPK